MGKYASRNRSTRFDWDQEVADQEILQFAQDENVDLIVLGGKGKSELGRYLLGSVANKVVQYAAKPVMVVR